MPDTEGLLHEEPIVKTLGVKLQPGRQAALQGRTDRCHGFFFENVAMPGSRAPRRFAMAAPCQRLGPRTTAEHLSERGLLDG